MLAVVEAKKLAGRRRGLVYPQFLAHGRVTSGKRLTASPGQLERTSWRIVLTVFQAISRFRAKVCV